jgi:hypothetical protein
MVGESMQAFGQKSATPDWNVTVTLAEPTFGTQGFSMWP